MNHQKLKHLIHKHHAHQRQQSLQQHRKEMMQKALNGHYQNDPYGKGIEFVLQLADLNHEATIHNYRATVLNSLTSTKRSPAKTRTNLSEFSVIQLSGIVADVTLDRHHRSRILIDHPLIEKGIFTSQNYPTEINRPLDSHIWLQADNVFAKANHYQGDPTVTVGDTIRILADIKSYQGKVQGVSTTRYGLQNVLIVSCGIPVKLPGHQKGHCIQSRFNRHHDWALKFKHLPDIQQIHQMQTDHPHQDLKLIGSYIYQQSKWSSYSDRMGLNHHPQTKPSSRR